MPTLGSISVGLALDSATFIRETQKVKQGIDQIGGNVQRSMNVAGGAVKAFGGAVAAAIGAKTISGFVALTKGALDSADELGKAAERAGVTVEVFQGLQFAASQAGSSAEGMTAALEQFNKRVGEASFGTGELKKVLEEQGIAITDSAGNMRSTNDLLLEFADVVANAGSAQERAALTTKGFGRGASELVTLFSQGSEGIRGYLTEAEKFALVTDEQAKASERANDAMDKANTAFTKARDSILVAAAPALEAFANAITKLIASFEELDPQTQAIIAGIAAFAAAATPLLAILAPIGLAIAALASPIVAVVAAIVGAAGIVAALILFRKEIGGALQSAVQKVGQVISGMASAAVNAARDLYEGVKSWLVDKLKTIWDAITAPINSVVDAFQGMYQTIVGARSSPIW